jgi:hypothetical protein
MTTNTTRSNAETLRHKAISPSPWAKLENVENPFDAVPGDKNVENSTEQDSKDDASSAMKKAERVL